MILPLLHLMKVFLGLLQGHKRATLVILDCFAAAPTTHSPISIYLPIFVHTLSLIYAALG